MSKATVAIVGRPNTGKSTFFNRIAGRRLSIVEDSPGVTRDRIYAEAEWRGLRFTLIDTGGIEPDSEDAIFSQMRFQAMMAMELADLIIFMTDGRDGLTAADRDVAEMLTRAGKPVLLVVNKIDSARIPDGFYDFYELGLGEPLPVSAANMLGLGDALDRVIDGLPPFSEEDGDDSVKIAAIGKPNVGKSSLINALLGEERVIVSEKAGTTRDSVDTPFERGGEKFTLIDTAGIRRKAKISGDIEKYSVARAITAIERSDVCLLMMDASEGVTEQDKRIAGLAHDAGKGVVIAVNKWDLIEKDTGTMSAYRREIEKELAFMSYAPAEFISVLKKQRLGNLIDTASRVAENRAFRAPTGRLNSIISDAVMLKPPPSDKGRRLKIYYAAQVGVSPPLFSLNVNSRELVHFSYARYLENRIRECFDFEGTSLKFVFRGKGDADD